MFDRALEPILLRLSTQHPVVSVLGPRQSGKTTLVRKTFPEKSYVNLEAPDIRQAAEMDPRGFLNQYPDGVILDEIQRVPMLLSYIQVTVDEKPQKGRFILTGSHQLALQHAMSQSLAGRVAILELWPMSLRESAEAGLSVQLDNLVLKGFFPRLHVEDLSPTQVYRDYVRTYIERDVRQMLKVKDLKIFQNFLRLLAGRIGQTINHESIGNDLGLSGHTIREWLSILEASYIVFRLPPYFQNFGKRIIKSPKLYFVDVGLLCYLIGIETAQQFRRDPLKGFVVENLVVAELMKTALNQGREPKLYFYRDHHQHEVDVVVETQHQLIPVEIKAGETFSPHFLKGLHFYQKLVGGRMEKGFVIYTGQQRFQIENIQVLNYTDTDSILEAFE